jgi:hypothetical protein
MRTWFALDKRRGGGSRISEIDVAFTKYIGYLVGIAH